MTLRDTDIEAESELMRRRREELVHGRENEEKFFVAVEAEKVYKEQPEGQETPTFGDGTRGFVLKLRDSIGRKLYEELDQRYGKDQ